MSASKRKKPTMKEMEKVINNVIHDMGIINQKVDASFFGIKNFITFMKKDKQFAEWLAKEKEKHDNERIKSDKASVKEDSGQSNAGK